MKNNSLMLHPGIVTVAVESLLPLERFAVFSGGGLQEPKRGCHIQKHIDGGCMKDELSTQQPMENLFDSRSLKSITGGEPTALRRLLDTLLASSRSDRARLLHLLEHNDLQGLAELAHRIKGAARVVGSTVLVESCVLLEEACSSQRHSAEQVTEYALSLSRKVEMFESNVVAELARLPKS
ncbi:MAG: Hpt domain-containing protein [Pseudomonas aeruginosa]